jgi:hypothetical protein
MPGPTQWAERCAHGHDPCFADPQCFDPLLAAASLQIPTPCSDFSTLTTTNFPPIDLQERSGTAASAANVGINFVRAKASSQKTLVARSMGVA